MRFNGNLKIVARLLILFSIILLGVGYTINIAKNNIENNLDLIHPEEIDWSSQKLDEAKDYAKEIGSAAVIALYDGKIFFSWGKIREKYLIHSIRKPFLGALYGIYIQRGMIDLDQTLDELGIDDIPPSLTEQEKQATLRDLLMARSGVYHPAAAEAAGMIKKRPARGSHAPGTFFYYNNWDFNALGAIFKQKTGKKIFEAFQEEIAVPIDMQDFHLSDCHYKYEWNKSKYPAYHFRMTALDLARFGLLYQNNGQYQDKQIISPDWIAESTTSYSEKCFNGDDYGYLWSIIPEESGFGRGFYHTGNGVQLLAVLPEAKLVFVHLVDTNRSFDITWQEIYQLMHMIARARLLN